LDIYIATSMRETWELEEVYDVASEIFGQKALQDLRLRWFDPTQSYEKSVIDKGLVESLMLKRAKCTIYLAQEEDTLGKDSELAATLAQGKPVVVYVPRYSTADEIRELAGRLRRRPLRFFSRRLFQLRGADLFLKWDNLRSMLGNLAKVGVSDVTSADLTDPTWLIPETMWRPTLELVGKEEAEYGNAHSEELDRLALIVACMEAVAADRRAATLNRYHPLAMQVNLGTGVANGVLLARSPKDCTTLVEGLLLNNLVFTIEEETEEVPAEEGKGSCVAKLPLAMVLKEKITGSRFRVVTRNATLTNAFWNYYVPDSERDK
jgi:hypothetical protein